MPCQSSGHCFNTGLLCSCTKRIVCKKVYKTAVLYCYCNVVMSFYGESMGLRKSKFAIITVMFNVFHILNISCDAALLGQGSKLNNLFIERQNVDMPFFMGKYLFYRSRFVGVAHHGCHYNGVTLTIISMQ